MAETLGQALDYINTLLPQASKISTDMKVTIINREVARVFKDLTSTNLYEFNTVADQATYSLPATIDFDLISRVFVDDSTNAVTSTSVFQPYDYAGPDDNLDGYKYYNHLGSLGIYPTPEYTGYHGRVFYQERPTVFASTDTSVQFNLSQDWTDIVKFRTMARIAKSGDAPDVTLGNNYEADAQEIERKLKFDAAKKRAKNPNKTWSYKDW